MAKDKKIRDKAAEKAVKERISKTHLKSFKILGSEKRNDVSVVTVLRILGTDNYLFRVNCAPGQGGYTMSGLIPVSDRNDYGEYRVYNPQPASADVLRPTAKEKKFTGYGK
ncbi:MAG: hypothetical protein MJ161_06370 [Clostridia bacterium]|nr:hypothetical protein [Clostridia bacterium]